LVNLFINLPIQEYIHSTIETFINEYIYILIGECIGKYKITQRAWVKAEPSGCGDGPDGRAHPHK
jgi:hypothetical protein